jgi:ubiquinone/menaquinone biosynthesis C-methylase UbiE
MMTKARTQIVEKIDETVDRDDVLCTTHQMRNFYQQLGDGYYTHLDIMNYIQHATAVRMARSGDHILDMCCGRGLLLPLLRYYKKEISTYTGVDVQKSNAVFRTKRVTDGKPLQPGYYPFQVFFANTLVGP